jgi:hypothetical protein
MGAELSPIGIKLYLDILDQVPPVKIIQALGEMAATRKFMPKPADILETLGLSPGNTEDVSIVEASKVLEAARNVSCYGSVVFDDPHTQAVIKENYGGWPALKDHLSNEDNVKFFISQFSRQYRAFKNCGIRCGGVLLGRFPEQSKTYYIGDTEKARAVEGMSAAGLTISEKKLLNDLTAED